MPTLKFTVVVEDVTENEYNRLIVFIKENIPTTDRNTPQYKEQSFDEEKPTRLTFKFRNEEQAMAVKLIL